jgi:hypothetical protein
MSEISLREARWLKKHLNLEYYSSFTNTEPSELCSEYRIETGYCIPGIMAEFMRLVSTRDEDSKEVTKVYLVCEEIDDE